MQAFIIKEDYSKKKEFNYFFCSDLHFGNKGQDRELLKKEFDYAREMNAKIFINGDVLDLILSGDRKRYHPSSDAYGTDNNVNMALNDAFDFFSEYVHNIVMIGTGNHEVSVSKFHHFDATQQLIYSLNLKHGTSIVHGQYSGYIILQFEHGENGRIRQYKIYYNHGQGGTAEISKGTIDLNRHMSTKMSDLCWLGHKHVKTILPSEFMLDVNRSGEVVSIERAGIITGAYMKNYHQHDAMKKGYNISFGEERMRGLQGTGGVMLKISMSGGEISRKFEI